jgi:hypothetical protein
MSKLLSQSDMNRRKHIMSQLKGLRYCLYNILSRLENANFHILNISKYNYFIRLNIFSHNIGEKVIQKGRYAGSKQSLGNDTITKYVSEISIMSKSTAYEYSKRLSYFEAFVLAEYRISVNNIIRKINDGIYDPYNVLSSYRAFLQDKGSISAITLKQQVITIKNFLEYSDGDISPK